MIRIEDFKTVENFRTFIINYLKKNNIYSKFVYNIEICPIYYTNIHNYIDYFYIKKINLRNFFTLSFNWRCSIEGESYWVYTHKNFCNYIKEAVYYDDCWSD